MIAAAVTAGLVVGAGSLMALLWWREERGCKAAAGALVPCALFFAGDCRVCGFIYLCDCGGLAAVAAAAAA